MINTMDKLVVAYQNKVERTFIYDAPMVDGRFLSNWTLVGTNPAGNSVPATGSGAACNNTTGGFYLPTMTGTDKLLTSNLQMVCMGGSSEVGVITHCYDRLWHTSGLNGNIATLQTVGTGTLPRYATGEDVTVMVEVYTALGATARTLTVNYTDWNNTSKSTAISIDGNALAGYCAFPNFFGKYGVKSVESVQLNAGTGTVGNFGITIVKHLFSYNLEKVYHSSPADIFKLGLNDVTNACPFFVHRVTGSLTAPIFGKMDFIIHQE